MAIEFTAHNVRLEDGTLTKPDMGMTIPDYPAFASARRVLEALYPGDRRGVRLADLGCLEGGFAVEFARMGFDVLGLEVRESNLAACRHVKAHTHLPNLAFVGDNAMNIARHGAFDVLFCGGLLYHLDRPREFLQLASAACRRVLIAQTHFSTERDNPKFYLSAQVENEGLPGRWYVEFANEAAFRNREATRWASWHNPRSFWIRREYLLQAIRDAGFDLVLEQFDGLGADLAHSMTEGYYRTDERGTFIGIKTRARD